MSRWRACGICWPATPGSSRSASRPTSGSALTFCSRLAMLAGVHPLVAIPLAGVAAAIIAVPVAASACSGCAGTISPSAPGWWRRCSACSPRRPRRSTAAPARACRPRSSSRSRRAGTMREFVIYWIALAQVAVDPVRHRLAVALALRAGAHRDPRQRARRALERRRCRAHQIRRLCRRGVRHRHGRRADLPAEDPHLARHRVLGQRLDRLRHLHHGDRRHRPDRGADHRHGDLLPVAADPGRSRRDLSSDPRRRRHRGHAEGAQGTVGPDRRPLRLAGVPAAAAAGDQAARARRSCAPSADLRSLRRAHILGPTKELRP